MDSTRGSNLPLAEQQQFRTKDVEEALRHLQIVLRDESHVRAVYRTMDFMFSPAVYKVYKDVDDGRTDRHVAVSECADGNFALIVTETYSNSSEIPDASSAKAVGETEVHPTLESANLRAKEIYEANIRDGFTDF